ncbi:MAG TPA: AAA family ATPase [Polyangiaceae bacterium]
MTYGPITTLEVENYGCIKKAKFELSSLHALIGPNDSGKSTTLRALRTVAQFAAGNFGVEPNTDPEPFDPMLEKGPNSNRIRIGFADGVAYGVESQKDIYDVHEAVYFNSEEVAGDLSQRGWNVNGIVLGGVNVRGDVELAFSLRDRITTATLVRFDPDRLRAPAQLIPEKKGVQFADERGTGLAGVFDAIINRDSDAFAQIQNNVRMLFPSVAKLGLINVSNSLKEIAVTLTDGSRIGAKAMSEGLLYYLGFAALKHVANSRLFLVEEPENGLHPARISEVMATLREISKTHQVVIATHSPLVINELEGHEVSVVTRDPEEGTQATLLKDVPHYDEATKVYAPGEFWLSYADGKFEEPLLTGRPRA